MPEHPQSDSAETRHNTPVDEDVHAHWQRVVGRRSFLKGIGLAGAAAVPGSALLAGPAFAQSERITAGDVSILRFLAAAEIIESDLWSQSYFSE